MFQVNNVTHSFQCAVNCLFSTFVVLMAVNLRAFWQTDKEKQINTFIVHLRNTSQNVQKPMGENNIHLI